MTFTTVTWQKIQQKMKYFGTTAWGEILLNPGADLGAVTSLPLHSVGVFFVQPNPFGSQLLQSSQFGGRQADSLGGRQLWRAVFEKEDVLALREASAQSRGLGGWRAFGRLGSLTCCFGGCQKIPVQWTGRRGTGLGSGRALQHPLLDLFCCAPAILKKFFLFLFLLLQQFWSWDGLKRSCSCIFRGWRQTTNRTESSLQLVLVKPVTFRTFTQMKWTLLVR